MNGYRLDLVVKFLEVHNCPLYAICTTGNRGAQHLVKECPYYCSTYTLSYPENMNMSGRFNSLFGVDKELLDCPEKLRGYIEVGVDRLVISRN